MRCVTFWHLPFFFAALLAGLPQDAAASTDSIAQSYAQVASIRQETATLPVTATGDNAPVDLTADSMTHDQNTNIVTARGNVLIAQNGRTLRAEEVTYNVKTDEVTANGNVILTEPNGDVHFADTVNLTDEMRDGYVESLRSFMLKGGRLTAEKGRRIDANKTVLTNATYTPCECDGTATGAPAWQIRAKEATYDEAEHRISYKSASFELFGVPVAWTPRLSHSDGQEERKSGFLTPSIGYDSDLGGIMTNEYYWAMGESYDATFGVMLTTRENPVGLLEYRQRFEDASLKVAGSFTNSPRTDSVNGQDVDKGSEARGHLFAESLWNINDKWRAGLDLELASDEQYLRQYNFSSEDVLENELYVERFSGRSYAAGRLLAFQDVRVGENRADDQPNIFPEVIASFVGEPNQTLGGRWDAKFTALGLHRDGNGQDVARTSAELGWERRMVSDFGLIGTVDLSVRGDAYSINDKIPQFNSPGDDDGTETRVFPQAHFTTSYPFVKPMEKMQAVVEPIAALTVAPNIDMDDTAIPNEDSRDAQIDALNLFEPNRFPGYDRIEDRSRVTYGLRTGLYGYGGSYFDVFGGQSYRFDDDDNPFARGSGLNLQESDYVTQISGVYDGRFGAIYRGQFSSDTLAVERHELESFADFGRLNLHSNYLYAKPLVGTEIDEPRQQVDAYARLHVTPSWSLLGGALYDLSKDEEGLRRAIAGIDYMGCCMQMGVTVERNLTSDSTGDSGTDIMFRVGLKGLGGFENQRETNWTETGYDRASD